jgi:putative ABC transport system permease protein
MQRVDLGFQPDGVLTAQVSLWGERYREPPQAIAFYQTLIERLKTIPGVTGAAGVGTVFLSATPNSTNFSIDGRPDFPDEARVEVPVDPITPDYFRVMNVRLDRGRFFDVRDTADSTPVVIINETMARMFWPQGDPLGQRIKYGSLNSDSTWMTIVGIVGDTRRTGYDSPVRPETYLPHTQAPSGGLLLVVRASGDPDALISAVRAQVRSVDPVIAVNAPRTLDTVLVEMTAQRRLNTLLLTVMAIVAAVLAGVGIYGVIAYSVEQRTRELGIRVALGARPLGILQLIVSEGLVLASVGLGLGLVAAFGLSQSMSTLLYGVSATDPATFAAIAGVALMAAGLASVLPALRAIRIDPVGALRSE